MFLKLHKSLIPIACHLGGGGGGEGDYADCQGKGYSCKNWTQITHIDSDQKEGMVPLAETAGLGLVPTGAVLQRTTKDTWKDSRFNDPTV